MKTKEKNTDMKKKKKSIIKDRHRRILIGSAQ